MIKNKCGSKKNIKLTISLEENIKLLTDIFSNDSTFKYRKIKNSFSEKLSCCIFYFDGMVDNKLVSQNIIKPIIDFNSFNNEKNEDLFNQLQNGVITSNDVEKSADIYKIIENVANGYTIFLVEGYSESLIINSKGWKSRNIEEPSSEKVLRGPKEGFTESIMTNISLIRRKMRSKDLKFEFKNMGSQTNTKICICYIEGIVQKKILNELNNRLDKIALKGVLDSEYVQEMIEDNPLSPFETMGSSERPDEVVAKLLEGRVALIVDGTPFVLTLPFLFIEYFQSSEDYYINFFFGTFNRLLRILSFFFSISVPAIYVALVTFNQEMLPTPLILSISSAREGVPFPTIFEILIMLIVFEILREAGTRIPTDIGQAISIVGALVLGQAAIEARIVSAPIVIIVGLTGIVSLLNIRMQGINLFLRFTFIILSAILGMYGYIFGLMGILIYTTNLRSFGVPYMLTVGSIKAEHIKDSIIRTPWWQKELNSFKISVRSKIKKKSTGNK